MKKLDGMMPPTLVFADEGKNGDLGPPPSSSIDTGVLRGLTIRSVGFGWLVTHARTPAGNAATNSVAASAPYANIRSRDPRDNSRHAYGTNAIAAIRPATMC